MCRRLLEYGLKRLVSEMTGGGLQVLVDKGKLKIEPNFSSETGHLSLFGSTLGNRLREIDKLVPYNEVNN